MIDNTIEKPFFLSNDKMGELEFTKVYVQYDVPRIFTCTSKEGIVYLFTQYCEEQEADTWIAVAITNKTISLLEHNKLSLQNAFRKATLKPFYKVRFDYSKDAVEVQERLKLPHGAINDYNSFVEIDEDNED